MLEYVPERHLTGGIRLGANKEASVANPIRRGLVPSGLVLALHQHRGAPAEPIVAIGARVRKGQMVARHGDGPSAAVHAATSGWVRAIEPRQVLAAAGVELSPCIVIETDGKDEASAPAAEWPAQRTAQLEAVRAGGLVGLGGAVFPTAEKLAVPECRALIVNGAECEPYISCDDVLMREAAPQIVSGALLMADLLGAPLCIIAVERDKPEALEAIEAAGGAFGDPRLKLAEVPALYPSGGERQLIELLTGEEVPSGRYPSEIGYVCQNVGTAFALHRLAREREPLTTRIVTVTGRGIREPQNVEAPIGTPIRELVAWCGGYGGGAVRLIAGGSMMGYALPNDELPITKACNCIVAAAPEEVRTDPFEWTCIRCGECAIACPARLLPQELLVATVTHDYEALDVLGLKDCIECGCCDVVCPSHIVLTERFRVAKHDHVRHEQELAFTAATDERFRRREERRRNEARHEARQRASLLYELGGDQESRRKTIEAAVERAKRHRADGADSD
jgi:Na+-translocating ferredoxin:NAD+ oxidoreductase subunit C